MGAADKGSVCRLNLAIKQHDRSGELVKHMLRHCRFAQGFQRYSRMIWVLDGRQSPKAKYKASALQGSRAQTSILIG